MLALKQYQGGWLHGLEGVGKTETLKELALTIAKQCIVFNCFHGLDTKSIGRILKVRLLSNFSIVIIEVNSNLVVFIYKLNISANRDLRNVEVGLVLIILMQWHRM